MAKKKENNQKSGASVDDAPDFENDILISLCWFAYFTTNFLPFWMYRPGLVILFTFKPLMV